jgi:hypothetical protein
MTELEKKAIKKELGIDVDVLSKNLKEDLKEHPNLINNIIEGEREFKAYERGEIDLGNAREFLNSLKD